MGIALHLWELFPGHLRTGLWGWEWVLVLLSGLSVCAVTCCSDGTLAVPACPEFLSAGDTVWGPLAELTATVLLGDCRIHSLKELGCHQMGFELMARYKGLRVSVKETDGYPRSRSFSMSLE